MPTPCMPHALHALQRGLPRAVFRFLLALGLVQIADASDPAQCHVCSDNPAPWMNTSNHSSNVAPDMRCTEYKWNLTAVLHKNCLQQAQWQSNEYCQHSCFDVGLNYTTVVCCPRLPEPPMQPHQPTVPPEA